MVRYAEPEVDNHSVLNWATAFELVWFILTQWWWIMVRYAGPVVCESWCAMLYQWWWIMESYAQPVVVNHGELCSASGCETLWVIPISVWRNHGVLCWDSRCESLWVMLSQWLCIMVCYSLQICMNHGEVWCVRCWQS